jgi:hypothetical protein
MVEETFHDGREGEEGKFSNDGSVLAFIRSFRIYRGRR